MPMSTLPQGPRRYLLPTHLGVPDSMSLSLFGFTVSVTMRQGAFLLFGWSVAFPLWQHSAGLAVLGTVGLVLRLLLPGSVGLLCLLGAFVRIAGRYSEDWITLLWAYRSHPSVYLWHPLPVRFSAASEPSHVLGGAAAESDEREEEGEDFV